MYGQSLVTLISGANEVVTPNFNGEGAAARDQDAGILIQVGGTADLESVRIHVEDERHGVKFSFYGGYLARDPNGNATSTLGPSRRLCGYEGMGRVGTFAAQSYLSIEDIRAYVIEGLRVIASNQMAIPKDEVVIQVKLAA
jgi:hypothetical protein